MPKIFYIQKIAKPGMEIDYHFKNKISFQILINIKNRINNRFFRFVQFFIK